VDADPYEIGLAIVGVAALFAAWIPGVLGPRALSLPVVLLAFGAVLFALPLPLPDPDPRPHVEMVERVTELAVVVSLMGAGLKIDRPFRWRTWSSTWRLLAITMPLTIALTAVAGATVGGMAAVSALLLGSVLAPTDPVLASDVQVGEPTVDRPADPRAEDEVRFALTSEGGLNDALAFPFVYAALAVNESGWNPSGWLGGWLAWDVVGRIALGLVGGWAVGRLLAWVAFRPHGSVRALAESRQGFVAIAATLCAYGATELVGGYGFLAVFVAAVTLRSSERDHAFHRELHRFAEQTETLFIVALLLFFGGAAVSGVFDGLTWGGVAVAVLVVFVIRPASGALGLAGSGLRSSERWAIAFFGIRGFGSVYYLAYATSASLEPGARPFPDGGALWAVVAFTLVISIATHGITATPAMQLVDLDARRRSRR
jgi:NhaP-type Na+/H+ or K+/H+ antiporter